MDTLPSREQITVDVVGRAEHLSALWRWLGDDTRRLWALIGDGGKGKTTVAYEFASGARAVLSDFGLQGVLWRGAGVSVRSLSTNAMSEGEVVGRRLGGVVALLGSFAFVGSATVGLGSSAGAAPSSPPPFTTPGTFSLLVPVGVDSITVVACAARGGNGEGGSDRVTVNGGNGALGGQSTATVAVTSGETLTVVVGARGGDGTGFGHSTDLGGTAGSGAPNGAGTGGNGFHVPNSPFGEIVGGPGGGGGGGSALLRGATELVSAGGGGGGSGGAIRNVTDLVLSRGNDSDVVHHATLSGRPS